MSLAIIHSRASVGIAAPPVTIEVHLSNGLPGLSIVGLPEMAVKESRHRVRSAIVNSELKFPVRRITVNLAPADLPKEGGRFDLPIALGILAASEQIPHAALDHYEFAGELALSGELRPIRGVLPVAIATRNAKRQLVIAAANTCEATLIDSTIFSANHLLEVCAHLRGVKTLTPQPSRSEIISPIHYLDLTEVKGQVYGKRALEIAAAGGHSLLFKGPPGAGKTLLAARLPGILPPMSIDEALEVAAIYSLSHQGFDHQHWRLRPFRAPHHTASSVALVGGSNPPQPGEISLAHHGVLFLDELPEFNRPVIESLREPLETGHVTISRAAYQVQFPSQFQFIAAMNPCPCGYYGDNTHLCRCTEEQICRYQSRLSGPLLDRIDMHVNILPIPTYLLLNDHPDASVECSRVVRERVMHARALQLQRQEKPNALLLGNAIAAHCPIAPKEQRYFEKAVTQLGLSARAYHRVLKLARTIADLDQQPNILQRHLEEALVYRRFT